VFIEDDVYNKMCAQLEEMLRIMKQIIESQRALIERLDRGAARSAQRARRFEALRRALELGALPGSTCPVSGRPTDN